MRKIESQMNSAIRGRRDWRSGNTAVVINDSNDALVYLHGNFIAKVSQHFVQLFDGGWQSVTTKSRLNAILSEVKYGCNVYQKDFNWFVSYADQVVSFFDNMILVDANHLEVA